MFRIASPEHPFVNPQYLFGEEIYLNAEKMCQIASPEHLLGKRNIKSAKRHMKLPKRSIKSPISYINCRKDNPERLSRTSFCESRISIWRGDVSDSRKDIQERLAGISFCETEYKIGKIMYQIAEKMFRNAPPRHLFGKTERKIADFLCQRRDLLWQIHESQCQNASKTCPDGAPQNVIQTLMSVHPPAVP